MTQPFFVEQNTLETWVERGEVAVSVDVVTLHATGQSYPYEPGIRVEELLTGEDTVQLVGRVMTAGTLSELGAEHFRDSLLLGETAYRCTEGFVIKTDPVVANEGGPDGEHGDPRLSVPAATSEAAPPGAQDASPPAPATDGAGPSDVPAAASKSGASTSELSDSELLADYLLKHL